jgi:hypothetical protein
LPYLAEHIQALNNGNKALIGSKLLLINRSLGGVCVKIKLRIDSGGADYDYYPNPRFAI